MDGTGRLYLAWADCRFRPGCTANDIVMTTSPNGRTWSRVTQVTSGPGDDIIPGIGAGPLHEGPLARVAITYYTIPDPRCTPASCLIGAAFTSSADSGASWTRPVHLGRPFRAAWLAKIPGGVMLSNSISTTVFPGTTAIGMFPLARIPTGAGLHQDMYAVRRGIQ